MNWWTDFWSAPSWWQDVLDRTSWLELIAAFVSVIASVVIALWIQRRDFDQRTREARSAESDREAAVERERRQKLLERSLDHVDASVIYAASSHHVRDYERLRIEGRTISALFASGRDLGSDDMAKWYFHEAFSLIESRYHETDHRLYVSLLSDAMRELLLLWVDGQEDMEEWSTAKAKILKESKK